MPFKKLSGDRRYGTDPFLTWSLSLVMFVGCAVPGLNTKEPLAEAVSRPSPSPEEMTHRFYYWREEAMELHEMASRREREADVLSKNKEGKLG